MNSGIAIVHVDDDFVVVDKPAGLLAVPGRGAAGLDSLAARVTRHWPDALVVHRLDMATSGLIVFARGPRAQRTLSEAFAARRVQKEYVAVVHGLVGDDDGVIDLPLAPDWPRRPRQQVDLAHGRPSLTHWRVLARDAAAQRTRVALEPVTGRSHQLRVHTLAIGHPVVGDALYAPDVPAPRLLLHAARLELPHPRSGVMSPFVSPVPF